MSNYLKIIRKTMRTPERTEKKSEGTDQIQISTQKGNTQKTLLLTLQEKPLWEMHRIRNNDQIFMIKGQIPLIDYGKTITLDNDFRDIFPKKLEKLYLLVENNELIPLFTETIMKNFNSFLAGESDINDNLYHGDCMDFVYALSPGKWVDKNKN